MIHAFDRGVLLSGGTHFHSEVMHELPQGTHTHTRTHIERESEPKRPGRLKGKCFIILCFLFAPVERWGES